VALALGELAQRRDAHDTSISEERYLERCSLKTARLFESACRVGRLASSARGTAEVAAFQQEIVAQYIEQIFAEGATLVDNPVSTAPGFQIGNVFVLAGVPAICRAMFDGLKSRLKTGDKVLSVTISAQVGEGVIAKGLGQLQDRYQQLEIGSYPFFRQGRFGASFVLRGTDEAALKNAAVELRTLIRSRCSSQLARRLDADDIVQSVFRRFFARVARGDYDVPPGEELWGLLLVTQSGGMAAGGGAFAR